MVSFRIKFIQLLPCIFHPFIPVFISTSCKKSRDPHLGKIEMIASEIKTFFRLLIRQYVPVLFLGYLRHDFIKGRVTIADHRDRKSTRLNSSHVASSYAVFCLNKKNEG